MRDAVAIILALGVAVFLVAGSGFRVLWGGEVPATKEAINAWRDVVHVIVGALAGYVARTEK